MVKITAKKTKKGQCQLTIEGEMTIYHANEMKEEFLANLEKCKSMEMDLTAVSEIDTTGFQLLLQLKRECNKEGKEVLLTSHSPAVLEVIELYGMEEYFGDPLVLPSAAY
jgi:anti-sigma B factor antagonist